MIFRFRYMQAPGLLHTYVRLFAGRSEGSLGLCGSLTLRKEEWNELRATLEAGATVIGTPANVTVEFLPEEY